MWAIIYGFVIALVVPILTIILRVLGIGSVAFVGFSVLIDAVKSQMLSYLGQLPLAMVQVLSMSGFFEVVSLIFSAYSIRLVLGGVSGDIKRVWSATRAPSF